LIYDFLTKTVFLLILILTVFSCGNDSEQQDKPGNPAEAKQPLISANKYLRESEDAQIEDFVSRYAWNMKKTGTGLRYSIYKEGEGPKAQAGNHLRIGYEISLLNGQVIYHSDTEGELAFRQGSSDIIRGLNEAALFLREGDQAKIIIPSHLAYGLAGDQRNIPPRATLIYDLKVLKVITNKDKQ
jgi:FKBP-type peptidyl-prolyl cis-trans isomerase